MSVVNCENCLHYINKIKLLESKLSKYENSSSEDEDSFTIIDVNETINRDYNEKIFTQGKEGLVFFILDIAKSKGYVCIDREKKKFRVHDYIDKRCKSLLDEVCPPLLKKTNKIYRIMINKVYDGYKIDGRCTENSSIDNKYTDGEYDAEIEEILAEEMVSKDSLDKEDDIDRIVETFLQLKKCLTGNKRYLIDELTRLL